MMKKLYSPKDETWIKLPRSLYKTLKKKLAEDQIAEFYLSFNNYLQGEDKTVKEIYTGMCCMAELVVSETFLEDVNKYSDKSGNINWKDLLALYNAPDEKDIQVVYKE